MTILDVQDLDVYYGDFQALFGLGLKVEPGEVVSIIGANGAGKSTLLKAIAGLLAPKRGEIRFKNTVVTGSRASALVRKGIALAPEGRRLFRSLSVRENLLIGGQVGRPGPWTLEKVYELFPILADRANQASTSLSGGQQQMVAIARGLMSNPDLLLCDELSLGLAPIVVREIFARLPKVVAQGTAVVIVEQDVVQAKAAADRLYCVRQGRLVLSGPSRDLELSALRTAYFGV